METFRILRDVDDEKQYAQMLEVAYCEAYCQLRQVLADARSYEKYRPGLPSPSYEMHVEIERLEGMRDVMDRNVQHSVERRKRLANIPTGLADVVLDEEGSEE